jgi:hypothetical protein
MQHAQMIRIISGHKKRSYCAPAITDQMKQVHLLTTYLHLIPGPIRADVYNWRVFNGQESQSPPE